MKTLLAIDPGVRRSGWARYESGFLTACGHDDNNLIPFYDRKSAIGSLNFVIEMPQVYGGRSAKGDTNDLLELAYQVGRFVEMADGLSMGIKRVRPAEWKGQTPKEVTTRRARLILTADEMRIIPKLAKSRAHNMWDAIAMGLWAVGRERIPTL